MNSISYNYYDNHLAEAAGRNNKYFLKRKEVLDRIDNPDLLNYLANNAKNEWIRLESALKCKNKNALLKLMNETNDEGIRLEAALELKDESNLYKTALFCDELFYGSIAIGYISNPKLLRKIVAHSKHKRLKAEAALKLGDIDLIAKLARNTDDEWIRYQLAASIGDIELLNDLVKNAKSNRMKKLAIEWIEEIASGY